MHHSIHLTLNSVTMKRAVPFVTNAPCPEKQPPPEVKPTSACQRHLYARARLDARCRNLSQLPVIPGRIEVAKFGAVIAFRSRSTITSRAIYRRLDARSCRRKRRCRQGFIVEGGQMPPITEIYPRPLGA